MLYLDVDALERHAHDPYLTDIILGLDLNEPTGRRLRSAFPDFFTMDHRPQMTPWSFLQRRFNILESYDHPEATAATLQFFNLPLEEFFSHEVPAVHPDVYTPSPEGYNGLRMSTPRVLTLTPEEVDGEETRLYVLEEFLLQDTPAEAGLLVTALSLQYLDLTR